MKTKSPMLGGAMLEQPVKTREKKQPKPKTNKTTNGPKSASVPNQQHGELPYSVQPPKPPTPRQMMRTDAKHAKISATRRWVSGELSNKEHAAIHARADRVLTNKVPKEALPKGW
jgi:hypothetical protein